jgi:predicted ArsR family transcriptional regulator
MRVERMGSEERLDRDIYVLMQPTRLKIVQALKSAEAPLYIEELAKQIGGDRKNIAFHLLTLAEHGFVDSEYRVIEVPKENPGHGKAGKYFWLTKKVDEVVAKLPQLLKPNSA